MDTARVISVVCIAVLLLLLVFMQHRTRRERFSQPSSATARFYAAGLRTFAPGARVDAFMMSLSRGEAVCSAFNSSVRRSDCKNDINAVTSPAPDSLVPVACDSFDATTKPLNDTDSNIAVFGRVYRFVKMCLPLSFDTRSGSLVNTDETALALVLSRAQFVRPTRSAMYSVAYDARGRTFDYAWPTALTPLSWSVVADRDVFDSKKGKTLTELLREQSSTAAAVRIPTTVYFLDEVERAPSVSTTQRLNVVTTEGIVTCDAKGTYILASVVGDTQLHVRTTAKPGEVAVRVRVGQHTVYEKSSRLSVPAGTDIRYAWTVLDTAVLFMLFFSDAGAQQRVLFGIVPAHRALAGVGTALPPNTYGYIPNFYRVYQRMKEGLVHRAVAALPQRFTLRPASIDPTKCLERRTDGAIVSAACAKGNEAQSWTADDTFAVRHAGSRSGNPCMQVRTVGATAYASTNCTANELMRFDQARRQLTWRDGKYCASSADGMLRVKECAGAGAGITAYDVMPFV